MTGLIVGHHAEPFLEFGYSQILDDPKQGLFLFGPLDERRPASMRVGVVGTPTGIELYKQWVKSINGFIPAAREDVLGLTKVNFNACIYGDGLPVTLRFADSVGEILTAGPVGSLPPLPFRHYIYPERARLIARRCHHAACRCRADSNRLSAKRRIVALFDRREEGIHVDMDDLSDGRIGHRHDLARTEQRWNKPSVAVRNRQATKLLTSYRWSL